MPNTQHNPRRLTEADQQVSRQVRILRKASGLTLVEAASALGVSWQMLHKYEMGESRIGAGRLQAIANLFGVPVSTFLDENAAHPEAGPASNLLETPGALELLQLYIVTPDETQRRKILTFVATAANLKP